MRDGDTNSGIGTSKDDNESMGQYHEFDTYKPKRRNSPNKAKLTPVANRNSSKERDIEECRIGINLVEQFSIDRDKPRKRNSFSRANGVQRNKAPGRSRKDPNYRPMLSQENE